MKKRFFWGIPLWIGILAGLCLSWPEPSGVPKAGLWTLDVTYEHPSQIQIRQGGKPVSYWYMILSLTNNTAVEEVPFYPRFELVTDTFQVLPAGGVVERQLFDIVKKKYEGKYPFLESLDFTDNRIRRGVDNTRDFVVFWRDFDPKADQVEFYLAGLSNETAAIEHPVEKDSAGNPLKVYLQKTLQLTYTVSSDPALRQQTPLRFRSQDWVMR